MNKYNEEFSLKNNEKNETKKEVKNSQKFKVVCIVSEKAVMTEGTKDKLLYSKPNKNYKIGQIID